MCRNYIGAKLGFNVTVTDISTQLRRTDPTKFLRGPCPLAYMVPSSCHALPLTPALFATPTAPYLSTKVFGPGIVPIATNGV